MLVVAVTLLHGLHDDVVPVSVCRDFAADLERARWPVNLVELDTDRGANTGARYDAALDQYFPASDVAALIAAATELIPSHTGRPASARCGRMAAMRVYIGADHGGFELKQAIIDHLGKAGHEPVDCGAHTYDADDDYPAYCIATAERTVADAGSLGIVLGGSGNGEQIAANKVPGARCALGWSPETAALARQHNNALLIGIGGRMHTVEEALAIVDAFVSTPWSQAPRHQRRVDIMSEYEQTGVAPSVPGQPA